MTTSGDDYAGELCAGIYTARAEAAGHRPHPECQSKVWPMPRTLPGQLPEAHIRLSMIWEGVSAART
jgi:hypothetical protein